MMCLKYILYHTRHVLDETSSIVSLQEYLRKRAMQIRIIKASGAKQEKSENRPLIQHKIFGIKRSKIVCLTWELKEGCS